MDNNIWYELYGSLNILSHDFSFNIDKIFSPTTEEGVPIRKLFIGNLARRTTNKDLQTLFSTYGKVDSCYIKHSVGKSNFGFVTFSDVDGAVKAREAAFKMLVELHCRILRVSSADSWHQPDSVKNQRKLASIKDINISELPEELDDLLEDPSAIQVLNDDCLIEVFLHLPIADRIRMERVCKRWQALIQESWRGVKKLDLAKNSWGLSPKIRVQLVNTNTLRQVLIRCGQFLTHLNLSELPHRLSSSTLTIVGKFCPNLQQVDITALRLSPSGIAALMKNCKNINKFKMKALTGPCEKDLSQLFMINKKLRYLMIDGDSNVTGKCLGYLPEDVLDVHLKGCDNVLSKYLDTALEKFNSLQSFTLDSCICATDSTLRVIAQQVSLTNLRLCGILPLISVDSMNNLNGLVNLVKLSVNQNRAVTDKFLINISKTCRNLNYLDITDCIAVTNRGIASLSSLTNLETLIMCKLFNISDQALWDLFHLKVLKCQRCTGIGDPGITVIIKRAQNLKYLDLSCCSITNSTLEAAISATKLRKNNTILKIIVGGTPTNVSLLPEISPFLQLVNVDLSTFPTSSDTE